MRAKQMSNTRSDRLIFTGQIIDVQRNQFTVKIEGTDLPVRCTLAGKMQINKIFVVLGEMVEVEVSPMDPSRGRIIARLSKHKM